MVVRLSALRTGRALLTRNIMSDSGTHFCYRLSKRQGLVRPDGLGKLKKFFHLIGLQPATFRLGTQCLNHCATSWYTAAFKHNYTNVSFRTANCEGLNTGAKYLPGCTVAEGP
jgi:hypothetical protein